LESAFLFFTLGRARAAAIVYSDVVKSPISNSMPPFISMNKAFYRILKFIEIAYCSEFNAASNYFLLPRIIA